jgi:hypothetical protein
MIIRVNPAKQKKILKEDTSLSDSFSTSKGTDTTTLSTIFSGRKLLSYSKEMFNRCDSANLRERGESRNSLPPILSPQNLLKRFNANDNNNDCLSTPTKGWFNANANPNSNPNPNPKNDSLPTSTKGWSNWPIERRLKKEGELLNLTRLSDLPKRRLSIKPILNNSIPFVPLLEGEKTIPFADSMVNHDPTDSAGEFLNLTRLTDLPKRPLSIKQPILKNYSISLQRDTENEYLESVNKDDIYFGSDSDGGRIADFDDELNLRLVFGLGLGVDL